MTDKKAGFSLIEFLLVVTISGVVISAIYCLYITQNRCYIIQDQVAEMQQNTRVAIETMVREIRMAGYDPTGKSGAGIIAAGSNSIRFTADLSGDGDTDDSGEDVTFSLYDSGNDGDLDLGKKVGKGPNQPVAENVVTLTFLYTLVDGSVTNNPSDPRLIRRVQIFLTTQTEKPDHNYSYNNGYRKHTLISTVIPRNL